LKIFGEGNVGEKAQIDYVAAKSHPGRRRATWLIVLAGFAFSAYLAFVEIKEPATVRYYQHKSMNFSLPPDAVVYEEDHDKASQLLKATPIGTGGSGLLTRAGINGSPQQVLAYYADIPFDFQAFLGTRMYRMGTTSFVFRSPAVFLHWRKAKGGETRLVYVRVNDQFALRGDMDDPSGFSSAPAALDWGRH
jgi:hypothetical protein